MHFSAPADKRWLARAPDSGAHPSTLSLHVVVMALLTSLSFLEVSHAAAQFGLELARVKPMSAGSVNSNFQLKTRDGASYFARLYEEQDQAGAERELRLLKELSQATLPVSPALTTVDGLATLLISGKPFAVFPWVDGEIYCQARVDENAAREVGEKLAELHLASAKVSPLGQGRFSEKGIVERLDRIQAEAASELVQAAKELREELAVSLERRSGALPSGVIHGDLFRDNVIWQGGKIAALLDFESASMGTFSYDIAVTLLAWCYSDRLEGGLCGALLSGYHRRRPLSMAEQEALSSEGALACVRFAVTRITDFSMRAQVGEKPVRDYRRFRTRLDALRQGALSGPLSTLALGA